MDLPLPRELWSVIGKHLSVLDKCALISTCQAIQAQLYNDPFWLDFTLTNLLRGLTMEEVIILTFSKANPDRLSHSRISQFKNFLTKNIGDNAYIEITLEEEERSRRAATAMRIGDLPSSSARHFAFHKFGLNFIALFCNVVTFISPRASGGELRKLIEYQKQTLKSLDTTEVVGHLNNLYGTLNLDSLTCKLITDGELELICSHCTSLRELKIEVEVENLNRQSKIIARMTSLIKLTIRPDYYASVIPYNAFSAIIQSIGSNLQKIAIKCTDKAFMDDLVLHCRHLETLRLYLFGDDGAYDHYAYFSRLAEQCASFPKKLNFRSNPHESGSLFFKQYGDRLKVLNISNLRCTQLNDLTFASNIESLDLEIHPEERNYEAALQNTIETFTRLNSLCLCVPSEHPTLIRNSHLTSVRLTVMNVTLDTPNAMSAFVQPRSLSIHSCNLTSLYVLGRSDPVQFGEMNVDWYKIKQLVASENKTYWRLVNDYIPADAKINYINGSYTKFRLTQKPTLQPHFATIKWKTVDSQVFSEASPFVKPKQLELHSPLGGKLTLYKTFTEKFPVLERLVLADCDSITSDDIDVLMKGLKYLKHFGLIKRQLPLPLLKIHSESLELLFLNKIQSIQSSDIVCPNLHTITFYIVGLINNQFSSGFCERTLIQMSETNSCPKLQTFHAVAFNEKSYDIGDIDDANDQPPSLLKLSNVPPSLQYLRLKRASHFRSINIVSDNLGEINLSECHNLKSLRIKSPISLFICKDMQNFQRLTIESNLMHETEITIPKLPHVKLLTPKLHDLIVCEPASLSLLDNLINLRHLEITTNDIYHVPVGIITKLSSTCPNLVSLKLSAKCTGISSSTLHALNKSYESARGSKIELVCDSKLMRGIEQLEARQKLPKKKQRMMHINALMKRTIINWKYQSKAKAFRSWRDFASKKNKKQ